MKILLSLVLGIAMACMAAMGEPKEENAKPANEIDALVARLAKTPMWENGIMPRLAATRSATTEDVLRAYCEKSPFEDGTKIREFTIEEGRQVRIGGPDQRPYLALRCSTDHGPIIFLTQYKGEVGSWWVRRFDVPAVEVKAAEGMLDPAARIVVDALERRTVPEVTMKGTSLEEAFDFVLVRYVMNGPGEGGHEALSSYFKKPDAEAKKRTAGELKEAAEHSWGAPRDEEALRVTYSARNVPVLDLMREIARQGGLDLYLTSVGFVAVKEGDLPFPKEEAKEGEVWKVVRTKRSDQAKQLLATVTMPVVDFDGTSVEEALDFLRVRVGELREAGDATKGIGFVERKPRAKEAPDMPGFPLSEEELAVLPRLTYSARDTKFGVVLTEVARQARLDVYLTTAGLLLRPAGKEAFASEKEEAASLVERIYGWAGK